MNKPALLGGDPACQNGFERWPQWTEAEKERLVATLESGWWGLGSEVIGEWEARFAELQGATHVSAVANGTVSLTLALRALGVGYGDEVILPPYTFLATAAAVLWVGAIPVFADIEVATHNIDPQSVRERVTDRTKAIVPVHIGGCPCDMDELRKIADEHGLGVLEDSAQAHGSTWNGKGAGTLGDVGSFSCQSSKNLSCGEGGMLTTEDRVLWERIEKIKNCGRPPKEEKTDFQTLGSNLRMSAFQASVLLAQADRFEEKFLQREKNWDYLRTALEEVPGIELQARDERIDRHALHLLILRYDSTEFAGLSRGRFLEALQAEGVQAPHGGYQPIYKMPGFLADVPVYLRGLDVPEYDKLALPNTEKVCSEVSVWIRQNALLGETTDRVEGIAEGIRKIRAHASELKE